MRNTHLQTEAPTVQLIDNRALINDALSQSAELTGGRFDHRYWLSKVADVKLLIISKPEVLFDLSVKVYIPLPSGQKTPLTYGDGWFNWHFLGSKSAVVTIAREILSIAMRNQKAPSPVLQAWLTQLVTFKHSDHTIAVLEPEPQQDLAGR
jgi:hypothetical protein|nr:hypothetical protein [Stutzerimonas stutzeri]|tara:strand:+ start:447 stop:899 length:453 start_codon:yes stop_codon:yes gene_type:complete